jgi:plasmid stability protein
MSPMPNEQGKPSNEPGTTTVRLPVDLLERVRIIAARHQRSLRSEVRFALMEYVRLEEAAAQ